MSLRVSLKLVRASYKVASGLGAGKLRAHIRFPEGSDIQYLSGVWFQNRFEVWSS